jgi:large subunit ribosomal protein L9
MKLILTQEVTGLGGPGDVVEVAGGYGRNYLIPRRLAMPWTRGAEKQIDLIKRARSVRAIQGLDDARRAAAELETLNVRLQTRAAGGPELDRRRIEVTNPIKTIGSHQVSVRLHPEVSASLEVEIVAA